MKNTEQSVMRSGSLNPMWGKRQSSETKKKISDSQKKRYEYIRNKLQAESTEYRHREGKSDIQAKIDLLKQCLFSDTIGFRDVQQALNFVAIMCAEIDGNYLKKVINDELSTYLDNINRHVQ